MVKFEFTLSDEDAENLFQCIASAQSRWTTREYLEELQAKLLHERVGEPLVVRNPKTGTLELTSAGEDYRKQVEHNGRPKDWPHGCPWPPE